MIGALNSRRTTHLNNPCISRHIIWDKSQVELTDGLAHLVYPQSGRKDAARKGRNGGRTAFGRICSNTGRIWQSGHPALA